MRYDAKDNPLKDQVVLINKFKDGGEEFILDQENTPWLDQVIDSITNEFEPEDQSAEKVISVDLKLKRDSNGTFGEYLFIEGSLKAKYMATCIRCLTDTQQDIESEFIGAYINKRFEDDPEYEEVDEIFIENQQADLFFHDRGKADLMDIVKEATFLAADRYPLHIEDCKGLCQTCGCDLNTETCGH